MRGGAKRNDLETLRGCWSRWTAIIELYAWRRPARRWVAPKAYAVLRQDLIATCRSLAKSGTANQRSYKNLAERMEPWLSPRVLSRTEPELLESLLQCCRQIERELRRQPWDRFVPPRTRSVLIVLFFFTFLILVIAPFDVGWHASLNYLRVKVG
jgi:hypothetical protein